MSKKKSAAATQAFAKFDPAKFENIHQIGGIRTGTIDYPGLGASHGSRVATFNTGAGLRFTVALDRGGDIIDASYNAHSLTFLSPNFIPPPNHAYHREFDWLYGWPAGLVTTCGPQHIGGPRNRDHASKNLHGHYSSNPAAVEMLINPDPLRGKQEMLLSMVSRDSRMFGPTLETHRTIKCTLGSNDITIFDQVLNRGNKPASHQWLYHVNFGYPLLDEGTRLIYRGKNAKYWELPKKEDGSMLHAMSEKAMANLKKISAPKESHAGVGENGVTIDTQAASDGLAHVGIVNQKLGLGVEMIYDIKQLPRLANWQHLAPMGSYVTGIEPYNGALIGEPYDPPAAFDQKIEPGETKRYQLTLRVLSDKASLAALLAADGPIKA